MKRLHGKATIQTLVGVSALTTAACLVLLFAGTTPAAAQSPPLTITSSVAQNDIWPPNHNLVDVGLTVTVTETVPGCKTNPYTVEVWSTQDDVDTTSTKNFSPDAKYAGSRLRLRAERSGTVDGRVYLIIVRVTDSCGNSAQDCSTAVLPHDRSDASVVSVDNQAEAAQTYCEATGMAPPGYVRVGEPGAPVIGPKQ